MGGLSILCLSFRIFYYMQCHYPPNKAAKGSHEKKRLINVGWIVLESSELGPAGHTGPEQFSKEFENFQWVPANAETRKTNQT